VKAHPFFQTYANCGDFFFAAVFMGNPNADSSAFAFSLNIKASQSVDNPLL